MRVSFYNSEYIIKPFIRYLVTGPYAIRIFVNELGLPRSSVQNDVPLSDFGGGHPDPNLVYAKSLVDRIEEEGIDFGAAFDGDGDRHMIYGKGAFVVPSDSVAIIAEYANVLPYFQSTGLKGVARSMPTSRALDLVAQNKNVNVFEVPTGKLFANIYGVIFKVDIDEHTHYRMEVLW